MKMVEQQPRQGNFKMPQTWQKWESGTPENTRETRVSSKIQKHMQQMTQNAPAQRNREIKKNEIKSQPRDCSQLF